jgi:hypothetical protein
MDEIESDKVPLKVYAIAFGRLYSWKKYNVLTKTEPIQVCEGCNV